VNHGIRTKAETISTQAIAPSEIGFQGQVVQCRILEQQMAATGFLFDAARRLRAHSRDGLVSWGWEHGQDLSVGYRPADCCGDGISSHDRLDDYKHGARSLSPRESARSTPQCASNVSMALVMQYVRRLSLSTDNARRCV